MTDSRANVEIEDVLSSIRRLVSQEVPPVARTVPAPANLRPASTAPVSEVPRPAESALRALHLHRPAEPVAPADITPEVAEARADGANDFLVLTPALRVSDAVEELAGDASDAEEAWQVEELPEDTPSLSDEDEWVVEELPHVPALASKAAEEADPLSTDFAEESFAPIAEEEIAEAPFWEDAVSEEALEPEVPQAASVAAWPYERVTRPEPVVEDAADLAGDAVGEALAADFSPVVDEAAEVDPVVVAEAEAEGLTLDYADDLGEELARLEHKIAEMEAAVALDGPEFEAEDADAYDRDELAALDGVEAGGQVGADIGAETSSLPEVGEDLSEWADDAARDTASGHSAAAGLPEEPLVDPWGTPGDAWDVAEGPADDDVEDDALSAALEADAPETGADAADVAPQGAAEGEAGQDPEHALWADSGALDWNDEDVDATASAAYEAGPRRLHLADAQEEVHHPRILRSTYEQMRSEDVAFEDDVPEGLFDEVSEGLMDEEALRVLVSEMIRQELQGTLGERITRNVRKLVRREIQRALSSQDFD
jgi:hypothetical protein